MTSGAEHSFSTARVNPEYWGRLVESAVGAHLLNGLSGTGIEVLYWREANREVDFVLKGKGRVTALEVTRRRPLRNWSLPRIQTHRRSYGAVPQNFGLKPATIPRQTRRCAASIERGAL
ncbi:MAG TPA: hypothetical protein DCZ01_10955 [Elusimicrobia bacterium]|nr:hypothetical protein [Elusimicrobiota bacterium]